MNTWRILVKLPKHAWFITSRKGQFWYRENKSGRWQVITEDNTLYPGFSPDVECQTLEEAKRIADEHCFWKYDQLEDEEE